MTGRALGQEPLATWGSSWLTRILAAVAAIACAYLAVDFYLSDHVWFVRIGAFGFLWFGAVAAVVWPTAHIDLYADCVVFRRLLSSDLVVPLADIEEVSVRLDGVHLRVRMPEVEPEDGWERSNEGDRDEADLAWLVVVGPESVGARGWYPRLLGLPPSRGERIAERVRAEVDRCRAQQVDSLRVESD